MILKQIFTTNSEQHTDIGNSYTLVQRDKVPVQFETNCRHYFGEDKFEELSKDVEAFIHYNQGSDNRYKTIPCFKGNYNAIMSTNGHIYNVITCMPD